MFLRSSPRQFGTQFIVLCASSKLPPLLSHDNLVFSVDSLVSVITGSVVTALPATGRALALADMLHHAPHAQWHERPLSDYFKLHVGPTMFSVYNGGYCVCP
eukprot:9615-Eustigmatos_ZCMA.PRE.1